MTHACPRCKTPWTNSVTTTIMDNRTVKVFTCPNPACRYQATQKVRGKAMTVNTASHDVYARGHEEGFKPRMRIWNTEMGEIGQFEIVSHEEYTVFRILYERLFGKEIKILGTNDMYEPDDNLG